MRKLYVEMGVGLEANVRHPYVEVLYRGQLYGRSENGGEQARGLVGNKHA